LLNRQKFRGNNRSMKRAVKRIGLIGTAGLLLAALAAADRPSLLSRTSAGLWELSGIPGASAPVRMCVADLSRLTRYEHRSASCTQSVIRDVPDFAEVSYSCGGRGFGRTTVRLLTPRSLRIETQGISANAPFHYVIQARRVGDCRSH
jgi:hypothetical protein